MSSELPGCVVAVISDPRAARSLRFSPSEDRFARTVDGYHPSTGCAAPVYVSLQSLLCCEATKPEVPRQQLRQVLP